MADIKSQAEEVAGLLEQVIGVLRKTGDAVDGLTQHNRDLKKSKGEIIKLLTKEASGHKNLTAQIAKARAQYRGLVEISKKAKQQMDLATSGTKDFTTQIKKAQSAVGTMESGVKKITGVIGKLTGALGITGISFGTIVKAGLQYNRSLFEIRRAQQVAGKGSADLASALDHVTKSTTLSKMQFAELANTIQSSFLGLKPTLMETAQLVETIGRQLGYSYEAQTKGAKALMSIQNQFPSVYADIESASNKLKDAEKRGEVTKELKEELSALRGVTEQRLQLAGVDASSRDVALQMISERTSAMKTLMETEKASAEATKEMDNARLEFFSTLQPMILAATKVTTKLIQTFARYKEVVIGVTIAFAAFKTLVPVLLSIRKGILLISGATKIWTAAALLNPFVLILASVAAVGLAIAALVSRQRKANAATAKMRKEMQLQEAMAKDRLSLSETQTKEYNDQWKAVD